MVSICEHTVVASHVKTRRRHEGGQVGEEPVRRHVGLDHPAAPGRLEEDADPAALESLDSVVGEVRAQHIAADPLELFAVAAVDGRTRLKVASASLITGA